MLTADLSVTDNGTPTNIGAQGAKTYALVANPASGATKRRIAATAATTPEELSISSALSGKGYSQRVRTVVRRDFRDLTTNVDDTGGVIPSASAYLVVDYPVNSGGVVTTTVVKNLIGAVIGVLLGAGNIDKLLNQES